MIVGYQLLHSDPSDSAKTRMIIIDWEDPISLLVISVSGARITPHFAVASITPRKSYFVRIFAAFSSRIHGGVTPELVLIPGKLACGPFRLHEVDRSTVSGETSGRKRRHGLSTFGPSFRVDFGHISLAKSTLNQASLSHGRIDPRAHLESMQCVYSGESSQGKRGT
jgi:hypothetical protein